MAKVVQKKERRKCLWLKWFKKKKSGSAYGRKWFGPKQSKVVVLLG